MPSTLQWRRLARRQEPQFVEDSGTRHSRLLFRQYEHRGILVPMEAARKASFRRRSVLDFFVPFFRTRSVMMGADKGKDGTSALTRKDARLLVIQEEFGRRGVDLKGGASCHESANWQPQRNKPHTWGCGTSPANRWNRDTGQLGKSGKCSVVICVLWAQSITERTEHDILCGDLRALPSDQHRAHGARYKGTLGGSLYLYL